jgi:hypothetical protein
MSSKFVAAAVAAACAVVGIAHADTAVTENTTVGGKAFIDLTSLDAKSGGSKTAGNGVGIDITRFYLVLNHSFDNIWSANLTTDFNYNSQTPVVTGVDFGQGTVTTSKVGDGETQLFIKKAYLQAKISDAFYARAGSADLPWVPFVEDLNGYRFVEKELLDRLKFGTSADWGVHGGGKLQDGMVAYAVSFVEGNGYKNPTRSKSLDTEGRISFTPVKGLTAALGFYSGKLGKDIEGTTTPAVHTANRYDALVNYAADQFRVGAEYFSADNWTAVTSTKKDSADGFSVFGSVNLTPTAAVFARYDTAKPNKDTKPTAKDEYFNIGVSMKERKGVDLAIAYKHDELKVNGAKASEYDEFGIWGQVAF